MGGGGQSGAMERADVWCVSYLAGWLAGCSVVVGG